MVKKRDNPLKIDFKRGIIEDRLQQILPKTTRNELSLGMFHRNYLPPIVTKIDLETNIKQPLLS